MLLKLCVYYLKWWRRIWISRTSSTISNLCIAKFITASYISVVFIFYHKANHEGMWESRCIGLCILDTSCRSTSCPGRFTTRERSPDTHWIGDSMDSSTGLHSVERRKILPLIRLKIRPIDNPVRSQSLSRLPLYFIIILEYSKATLRLYLGPICSQLGLCISIVCFVVLPHATNIHARHHSSRSPSIHSLFITVLFISLEIVVVNMFPIQSPPPPTPTLLVRLHCGHPASYVQCCTIRYMQLQNVRVYHSSGLWHSVLWQVITNVSEENAASSFRIEVLVVSSIS
jgi:hypothetical protein